MPDQKIKKAILITIVVVCGCSILAIYILPQLMPCYKCPSPCSYVESDANNIAAAIADYFSIPGRQHVKPGDLDGGYKSHNPWTFIQCQEKIYIYVYDHSEGCSIGYQDQYPEWNAHIYTKVIE